MFNKLQHTVALAAGKTILNGTDEVRLSTGKRMISILAGAFIFRRGLKNLTKSPIIAVQELALGGLLLYNGATGENKLGSKARQPLYGSPYKALENQSMPNLYRVK
ncbi:hypothetical protein ACTHQF_08070 [Pedobacter sp. SAFR-022]|uniref:hypothetical protein n=1 Tax=Pedobacter sp. SAFR-022 TaxID=3436861 RepID=UPI003F7D69AB